MRRLLLPALFFILPLVLTLTLPSAQSAPGATPTPETAPVIILEEAEVTPTGTPTETPTPMPACPTLPPTPEPLPTATPLVGSVIVRAWVDSSDDGLWQTDREPGVDADVVLLYQGFPADGVSLPTGARGLAVAELMPGGYWVLVRDWRGDGIYPTWDMQTIAVVSTGSTTMIDARFWRP